MKSSLRKAIALALSVFMLLSTSALPGSGALAANDPYIAISEDFEGLPPYKIGFNSGTNSLGGNVKDVDGSQALYLSCNNQTGARSNLMTLEETVRGSKLQVEFDWQVGAPSSARNAGVLVFQTESQQKLFTLLVQNTSDASTRFRYFTGDYITSAVPSGTALNQITALNTWYSVKVVFDFSAQLIDLTVTNRSNPSVMQAVSGIPFDETTDYYPNLASMFVYGFRMSGQNLGWNTSFDNFAFTVLDSSEPVIPVREVSITGRNKVEVGGRILLYPHVSPATAYDKTVTWASLNPDIASVDSVTGVVTGVGEGSARISATAGGVTGYYQVTVGPLGLPARQMEALDRGLVAVPSEDGEGIFIAWRMLGTDPGNIAFNLYRDGVLINPEPIATKTNYVDTDGTAESVYRVSSIVNGVEATLSEPAEVWEKGYLPIPLNKPEVVGIGPNNATNYEYNFEDSTVADLDGDGEYEIIGRWTPTNAQDVSISGYTGPMYLDAYKLDGTLLWRISMGKNIRAGQHYMPFMVYDLDGCGKAEVVMRTADGTVDGAGNVIGDPSLNWVNSNGHIADGGIEYLTVFSGETGEVLNGYTGEDGFLHTDLYYPQRGKTSDWGDSNFNRSERFQANIAYLDGARPSVVMCRGYYTRTVLAAWDWDGQKLTQRWVFDSDVWGKQYEFQGNHQTSVADVDGDGFDEIIFGAMTIDHDGSPLYNTGFNHGDALHVSQFDPERPGLQVFSSFENPNPWGFAFRDAQTGDVIWGVPISGDTDQCMAAHIDPRYPGALMWTNVVERVPSNDDNRGIYNLKGEKISENKPISCNFVVWWDGDLQRELLDRDRTNDITGQYTDPNAGVRLDKWDWENETTVNLKMFDDCRMNDAHKGVPCLTASVVGDWREDILLRNADSTELRLYTTNIPTDYRFYTLMHDPQYRVAIAWQNTVYNQPPHPSFYIGEGMDEPAAPNIYLVGDYNEPDFPTDDAVITELAVSPNIKNLVYGCAANIPVTLSVSEGSEEYGVYVALYADGERISDEVKITDGKAVIKTGALIYYEDVYVGARFEGAAVSKTAGINVRKADASLWSPYFHSYYDEAGGALELIRIEVLFNEKIAPASGGYAASVDGQPAAVTDSADMAVTIDVSAINAGEQSVLSLSKVMYPELFPSYSFTFRYVL